MADHDSEDEEERHDKHFILYYYNTGVRKLLEGRKNHWTMMIRKKIHAGNRQTTSILKQGNSNLNLFYSPFLFLFLFFN